MPSLEPRKAKDAQISIRIPTAINDWLRHRAGRSRSKADVVREVIEREMAREDAARLQAMFDGAAQELTAEDRSERDLLLGGFANRE